MQFIKQNVQYDLNFTKYKEKIREDTQQAVNSDYANVLRLDYFDFLLRILIFSTFFCNENALFCN